MQPIKLTREMFPNLPDEIWDMFIVPLNDDGLNIFDSTDKGRWFYHFGGLSIDAFAQLKWQVVTLSLNKIVFDQFTVEDINTLIRYCSLRDPANAGALFNGYSPSSKTKLVALKEIIKKTRRLPAPIVGIRTNAGLKVLDGLHRLSAALSFDWRNSIPIDTWIGE